MGLASSPLLAIPMPPRPIHRSKSFWLGLFILAFLCWAWLVSSQDSATARWGNPGTAISITSGWGAITIERREDLIEMRLGPGFSV